MTKTMTYVKLRSRKSTRELNFPTYILLFPRQLPKPRTDTGFKIYGSIIGKASFNSALFHIVANWACQLMT